MFGVFCCQNRGLSQITRISRILRVSPFVIAQFIAPFFESRICTDYTDNADYLLSESRICTDDTDFADWYSVTSGDLLRGQFFVLCYACADVSSVAMSGGNRIPDIRSKFSTLPKALRKTIVISMPRSIVVVRSDFAFSHSEKCNQATPRL